MLVCDIPFSSATALSCLCRCFFYSKKINYNQSPAPRKVRVVCRPGATNICFRGPRGPMVPFVGSITLPIRRGGVELRGGARRRFTALFVGPCHVLFLFRCLCVTAARCYSLQKMVVHPTQQVLWRQIGDHLSFDEHFVTPLAGCGAALRRPKLSRRLRPTHLCQVDDSESMG